jgi:hypothetical protein
MDMVIKIGNLELKPSCTTPNIYIGRNETATFIRVGIHGVELLSIYDRDFPEVLGVDMI